MCKGIDEIIQTNYEKGRGTGIKQGIEQGENKKEKEAINSVYKTMETTDPTKTREEIIDFLCKAFNMSANQINKIISSQI